MTRRIQIFSFEQITVWLIYTGEALYRSGAVRFSLAACVLGLSLARVTHSASLYFISTKLPAIEARAGNLSAEKDKVDWVDPQLAMGGALFQRAAETTTSPNSIAEQPAKPFKLTATLESSSDIARALIEIQGEGSREYCAATESCRRGDCVCVVQNAEVVNIAQEQIWLKMGNARYALRIGQSSTDVLTAQGAAEKISGQTGISRGSSEIVSQTISRESVIKILEGKEGPILNGQFGPYVVDGRIEGYKITRIGDEHIFAKLGAKNGDVIRKVNGYPLDGMERLMDLWKTLPTTTEIRIQIERNGKPVLYEFQVRK